METNRVPSHILCGSQRGHSLSHREVVGTAECGEAVGTHLDEQRVSQEREFS